MPCAAEANQFLSFPLTWRLEFCIFLLTTSTNMRLFNTKKTVTAFSIDLHCLLRQGEWIPLYFKMLFVWNVGPVFWKRGQEVTHSLAVGVVLLWEYRGSSVAG